MTSDFKGGGVNMVQCQRQYRAMCGVFEENSKHKPRSGVARHRHNEPILQVKCNRRHSCQGVKTGYFLIDNVLKKQIFYYFYTMIFVVTPEIVKNHGFF